MGKEMLKDIDVKKLAEEVVPEYKQYIYCYLDKAVKRYAPPFVNDKSPEYMVDGLKSAIIKGQHIKELTGLSLCYIGIFELSSGSCEVYDKPRILIDCDQLVEKVQSIVGGDHA